MSEEERFELALLRNGEALSDAYIAELEKAHKRLTSEIERLRDELATAKEDWHNQYTTSMHLSAELAEAKEEIDHLRAACGLRRW